MEAVAPTCTASGEQRENPFLRGVQPRASPPLPYAFKNVFLTWVITITLGTVQEYCE